MGRLIVIEGLDGAGKRTLADKLTAAMHERGVRVVRRAFPRYGKDIHADLVRDGLHGRLGGLGESAYGMAVLYALDRRGAADDLRADLDGHDVLLLDRYVASNAAYGAARLHEGAGGEFVSWVRELEVDRFGLRVPDAHLLLRVSTELAAQRAAHRERTESDRERDTWEADADLQARCAAVYDELAATGWLAPWHVLDGAALPDLAALVDLLIGVP